MGHANIIVLAAFFTAQTAVGEPSTRDGVTMLGDLAGHIPAAGVSDLQQQVSGAVTAGARYLLQLPNEDPKGRLFVPPYRTGAASEYMTTELRYRWVSRSIPEYEYENYTVMERDAYGEMKPTVRRRPVKQIGTREEKYLVHDDNGSVVITNRIIAKRSAADFVGPDRYQDGVIGQNGLCLYALLSVGVPAEMEPIPGVVQDLVDFTSRYGLPDWTWDLAWLAAGLCRLPDGNKTIDLLRTRIANKLLLGQIESGPGKGLWGPYAMNPELIAVMVKTERKNYLDEIAKLTTELRSNPDDKSKNRKLGEIKKMHQAFTKQYKDYELSLRNHFAHAPLQRQFVDIRPDPDNPEYWVQVLSTPYNAFGERLGDVESTRIALFALRLLAARGNLPTVTIMPKDDTGKDLVFPKRSATVIESGLKAVAACRDNNGAFHEGNVIQSFSDFDSLGYVGLPIKPNELPKLQSNVTLGSMVNAYAALQGGSGFSGVQVPGVRLDSVAAYLEDKIPGILDARARRYEPAYIYPFSLILALSGIGPPSETLNQRLIHHVLDVQNKTNGCWSVRMNSRDREASTSLKAFFEQTLDRWHVMWKQANPEKNKEFTEADRKKALSSYHQIFARDRVNDVYCTATALAYLSQALRPLAAGFWPHDESSMPAGRVLNQVLAELNRRQGGGSSLSSSVFGEDLSALSGGVPFLLTGGRGSFTLGSGPMVRLSDYLAGGGMVIGLADAGSDGVAFIDALEKVVMDALPGSSKKRFTIAGYKAEVDAVIREDGSAGAVLLVAGNAPNASSPRPIISVSILMNVILEIAQQRIGPERMTATPLVDLARLTEVKE